MKTRIEACLKCREAVRIDASGTLPPDQRSAVEQHVAACADCRRYEHQLRTITQGLRSLGTQPVRPGPGFRARWTSAIAEADPSGTVAQAVSSLITGIRLLGSQNRRAFAALAPVWVLILLFKLTTPHVGTVPPASPARSPLEIFRTLKIREDRLMALEPRRQEPASVKPPITAPRSGRSPMQPTICSASFQTQPHPGVSRGLGITRACPGGHPRPPAAWGEPSRAVDALPNGPSTRVARARPAAREGARVPPPIC